MIAKRLASTGSALEAKGEEEMLGCHAIGKVGRAGKALLG